MTAAVPEELIDFGGRERTFTSPQITDSEMQMYSLNGTVQATSTLSLSGVGYYRHFKQGHIDGNISEFGECEGDGADFDTELCTEDGAPIFGVGSGGLFPLEDVDDLGVLGSIDKTGQDANSYGGTLQAADKSRLFGHRNLFVVGTSYDHGHVDYQASSELGFFKPKYVVQGTGITLSGDSNLVPGDEEESDELNASEVTPRSLTTLNDYFGFYAVDAFDVTDKLTVTLGGRFNYARIEIQNTGEESLDTLNGTNTYKRFNPSAGLTYQFIPGLSLYGGYSEANRAPTASEIACSDRENPCIIESALASDPPVKQVVSKTWEAGLRGEQYLQAGLDKFEWSVGIFRSDNSDDIIQIADFAAGARLLLQLRRHAAPGLRSGPLLSHAALLHVCQLRLCRRHIPVVGHHSVREQPGVGGVSARSRRGSGRRSADLRVRKSRRSLARHSAPPLQSWLRLPHHAQVGLRC